MCLQSKNGSQTSFHNFTKWCTKQKKKNDRGRKVGKRRNKGTVGLGVKNKSNVGKRKENISEEREILK